MEKLKTITLLLLKLFLSIVLQTCLLPIRIVAFVFSFVEKLFRILKNVSIYLINEITNEVIK